MHQGKPSSAYDESCNGTWLLMEDIYENRQWHSSNVNDYEKSTIHSYLNSTFLGLFDANIQSQIKQVKLPYRPGSGYGKTVNSGANGLSAKIFLLSGTEVSMAHDYIPVLGAELAYFKGCVDTGADTKRVAKLNGSASLWWLRCPYCYSGYGATYAQYVNSDGYWNGDYCSRTYGIRPALILPSSLLISDDGSVNTNTAPTTPASITIPSSIQGGTSIQITWAASTDAENNLEGYVVERSVDGGGAWTQVYKGADTSHTDNITRGWNSVNYRVRAYDEYNAYSPYTEGTAQPVNNNRAPTITCDQSSGTDMGKKTEGFSITYSVNDEDGDSVTVTEAIDGVTVKTYTPTLTGSNTFDVTGDTFFKLLNGSHTLTITASDGKVKVVHKLTFTKEVTEAGITLKEPFRADAKISICVLSVAGDIPADAEYKVEVTNNAKDDAPVWEDCTMEVKNNSNHVFTNETAEKGFAFNFRVTVKRGPSGKGGYINSIQGGFQ